MGKWSRRDFVTGLMGALAAGLGEPWLGGLAGTGRRAMAATPGQMPAPDLALAEVYAGGVDVRDYLVSEKLDGVRAYWNGRALVSRGGLVLAAPARFTAGLPEVPLDGELWLGRGRFAEVSGLVRRLDPAPGDWDAIRYIVFDLPAASGPFDARLTALTALVEAHPSPFVDIAEQQSVADEAALMALLDATVAAGGEGLMLHRRDAAYRGGRSADLLKLKPFQDAEARVVAHLPGRGKYQGQLGALLCELPDGRRFRLGTGLTDAERAAPPPVGSLVSFRHQGLTKNGLPRFASFLRPVPEP